MVTELIEAQNNLELTRLRNRWTRYDLIVIDELGYVVMPDAAAELLFQVIAGRAEQSCRDCHYELTVFRVDNEVPQHTAMQGDTGPADGPGPHHRNRR